MNMSGLAWTQRVHLGVAQKKGTLPLLVPNVDFQEPPRAKVATNQTQIITEVDKPNNQSADTPSTVLVNVRLQKFKKLLGTPTIDLGKSNFPKQKLKNRV